MYLQPSGKEVPLKVLSRECHRQTGKINGNVEGRWGQGELEVRRPIRNQYSSSLKRWRAGTVAGMVVVAVGFESNERIWEILQRGATDKTWLMGCVSQMEESSKSPTFPSWPLSHTLKMSYKYRGSCFVLGISVAQRKWVGGEVFENGSVKMRNCVLDIFREKFRLKADVLWDQRKEKLEVLRKKSRQIPDAGLPWQKSALGSTLTNVPATWYSNSINSYQFFLCSPLLVFVCMCSYAGFNSILFHPCGAREYSFINVTLATFIIYPSTNNFFWLVK